MLPTVLPLTPFITPIKKRWEDGQEKKERTIKVDPDAYFDEHFAEGDDTIASESSEEESEFSEDEYADEGYDDDDQEDDDISYLDDYAEFVTSTLLPKEAEMGQPQAKLALAEERIEKKAKKSLIDKAWARFQAWRDAERIRRKHYIYREYEARVAAYDLKMKAQLQAEIEAMKKEVMLEAHRLNMRRKQNSTKKKPSKWEANRMALDRFNMLLEIRDKEDERIEFFCLNLQRWAVEKHDHKIAEEELRAMEARAKAQQEAEAARIAERARLKEEDAMMLAEDVRMTQSWKEAGRRIGTLAAVNVPVKLGLVDDGGDKGGGFRTKKSSRLVLHLKEDFDARMLLKRRGPNAHDHHGDHEEPVQKKGKDKASRKPYTPFSVDLDKTAHVLELKCVAIGERGALSLAAELLRGACSALVTLDLARCQIQTRGLGRLLHGIKLSNLMSLRRLLLRGNDIGPRGLEYLKLSYYAGAMQDLAVLDLRENELGDEGADIIFRMIIAGYFVSLRLLWLQNNGIGDTGFTKIAKALNSMGHDKCPNLQRIGMEGNPISGAAKRSNAPLGPYWSV